ncbi:MAG: hypothetical protein Q7R39_19060 [Dehalococcoidia bacterium]|nr:hypothetical protein [Dehalococcoidia bacterium]
MKRWTRAILVVIPLALITLLAAAACEEASPPASSPAQGSASGPQISIDKESVDFGKVPLDKEVRAVFTVKNVGTDTLTMRDVKLALVQGC